MGRGKHSEHLHIPGVGTSKSFLITRALQPYAPEGVTLTEDFH